jgi:transcriptional regulator with XRE-family HTH domain
VQNISARFRNRLRQLRESRNWTQEEAAEACGIGYKLYQHYELGVKENPGLVTLQKLAAGFGLDVSEFLSPRWPKNAKKGLRSPRKTSSRLRKKRRTT